MLTKDGLGLAVGVVLGFAGIINLIFMITQYRCKGPVMSAAYFAADVNEREHLRTKKAYHSAGNHYFSMTLICCFFSLSFIFDNSLFAYLSGAELCRRMLVDIIYAVTEK